MMKAVGSRPALNRNVIAFLPLVLFCIGWILEQRGNAFRLDANRFVFDIGWLFSYPFSIIAGILMAAFLVMEKMDRWEKVVLVLIALVPLMSLGRIAFLIDMVGVLWG